MKIGTPSNRRGFTLLETLIALGLVSIIMSTVWSLLSMFARVERQGAERALELQLVRSIGSQLQNDFDRLVVPVDSATSSGTTVRPPATLIGTATELQIFCRSVSDPWPVSPPAVAGQAEPAPIGMGIGMGIGTSLANPNAMPGTSDESPFQQVIYQFVPSLDLPPNAAMQVVAPGPLDGTGARGNPLLSQAAPTAAASDSDSSLTGLTGGSSVSPVSAVAANGSQSGALEFGRMSSDASQAALMWSGLRRTVTPWPPAGSPIVSPVTADELPELTRCRFRYFDGTRWLDSWGSIPAATTPTMASTTNTAPNTTTDSTVSSAVGSTTFAPESSPVDALPVAIEIQFDLDVSGHRVTGAEAAMELTGTWMPEHRWVIYVHQAGRVAAAALDPEATSP